MPLRSFFVFVFCITLIRVCDTLMVIYTLKTAVGETDSEVQKWNEMAWSRFYCMGYVVLVNFIFMVPCIVTLY